MRDFFFSLPLISTYSFYVVLLLVAIFFIFLVIITILLNKYRLHHGQKKQKIYKNFVLKKMCTLSDHENLRYLKKNWNPVLHQYINLSQSCHLDKNICDKVQNLYSSLPVVLKAVSGIRSLNRFKRMESAMLLGYLKGDLVQKTLEYMVKNEKYFSIKLYAVDALLKHGNQKSIPVIVESLIGSPERYQQRVHFLLGDIGKPFHDYISNILEESNLEIQKLIIAFSCSYTSEILRDYLFKQLDCDNPEIVRLAANALKIQYPSLLQQGNYLASKNDTIQKAAILSLSQGSKRDSLDRLLILLDDQSTTREVEETISKMIQTNPFHISYLIQKFADLEGSNAAGKIAKILSNHLDYLMIKLLTSEKEIIRSILKELLYSGINREMIGFLNKNKNSDLENEMIDIFREIIPLEKSLKKELSTYLSPNLLAKLELEQVFPPKKQRVERTEKEKIIVLAVLLVLLIGTAPTLHIIRYFEFLTTKPIAFHLKSFMIDFSYGLAYYSTSINVIYILLLIFSFLGLKKQVAGRRIKNKSFLFNRHFLPSISIIAPAYCEEGNIIESANSLLNLNYPNYELIIVNDGSTDETINRLIEYYHLEQVEYMAVEKIQTMPVLGIYKNPSLPKLTVIDKVNGGKADSLNVGINSSTMEYVCGIDADSLLEPDALLNVVSQLFDSDKETVAMGGNIFPINGCDVNKGVITHIALPKHWLGKFQTIEYLRSYMAGRIGWSYIKCLLIISGAFGVFKKSRVFQIGGYLTNQGRYQRDTVGEDMELVVRLNRHMQEQKVDFEINYAYNANCWTEVPESMKILSNQRNRWHRGLIDILFFHWKIFFRPAYGRMGLIAFPYFLIFEVLGPLLELQGYLIVIISGLSGFLNKEILIILFTATVMLGILISLCSLLIAEKEQNYYSFKESLKLMLYAVVENFGFRQYVSFERVIGYFSSMKKIGGWGKMERKGFETK
jgi:peptidoglycan-N-acetylglucosamine deacetylase